MPMQPAPEPPTDGYDWKQDAIDRYQAAQERERQEAIERTGPLILKALELYGLTGTPITRPINKADPSQYRVVVRVDGIYFGLARYEGVTICKLCPTCQAPMQTLPIHNWVDLGRQLTNPHWEYHNCPGERDPDRDLLTALDGFIQARGYKLEE